MNDIPTACSLCESEPEEINHVFICCPIAKEIWRRNSWWSGINFYQGTLVGDLLITLQANRVHLKIVTLIRYTTLWLLWKNRITWIFEKRRNKSSNLTEEKKNHLMSSLVYRLVCPYEFKLKF